MKTQNLHKTLALLAVAGLTFVAASTMAQDTSTATTVQVTAPAPAPQLSYGTAQIVQLTQAKIGEDTIVAYVKNSGNSYGLDANQIIYLRQQGVSDAVITAMLNQPKPAVASAPAPADYSTVPAPTTPPPQVAAPSDGSSATYSSTATVAPTVTYVQTAPTYYSQPYYYPYYYPYYGYYPGVSIGWGWYGGGWRGGGWRGDDARRVGGRGVLLGGLWHRSKRVQNHQDGRRFYRH